MPILKLYKKDFFKVWNPDMAYILGFLFADGNILKTKRNTYFISLYTADKPLLEMMRKALGSNHKLAARTSDTGVVYRMQVGSKMWFEDLQCLGLVPNKATRMRFPIIPSKYQGDFIRGYFDGDGNVWMGEIHKTRKTSHLALQVAFTSGSYHFLQSLHVLLNTLGVLGGSLFTLKGKNYSRLSFSSKDALKIYKIMYTNGHKLFLPRKKQKFEEFDNCGGSSTG